MVLDLQPNLQTDKMAVMQTAVTRELLYFLHKMLGFHTVLFLTALSQTHSIFYLLMVYWSMLSVA
jgi:hypothetical protein